MQTEQAEANAERKSIWPGASGIAVSYLLGGVLLTLTNALGILLLAPFPGSILLRLAHHFFDALETIGLCLLCSGLALGAGRVLGKKLPLKWLLGVLFYAALGGTALGVLLEDTLARHAIVLVDALGGSVPGPAVAFVYGTFLAVIALALPLLHVIGHVLARWRIGSYVALGLALGAQLLNHYVLSDAYEDVHTAISWGSVCLAGSVLAPQFPKLSARFPLVLSEKRRPWAFAAGAFWLLLALFVAPPNRVRFELFKTPSAAAEFLLAQTLWTIPTPLDLAGVAELGRTETLTTPTAEANDAQRTPVENPVVVLLTLDAVRADALTTKKHAELRPTLNRLRDTGAHFENAFAPGSQTVVSLSSLFTGRYYSQLHWTLYGRGEFRRFYPTTDRSPRLPELLDRAKIGTTSAVSPYFLAREYGVTRGFRNEHHISNNHATAAKTLAPLLAGLRRHQAGPGFFYAHLMDAHEPYDRGKLKKGAHKERYLSEIDLLDQEIQKVSKLLAKRFPGRGYLIISADHGEAFGEHRTTFHSKTLYNELLHVPLLIHGPNVAPGPIAERVGLIDLGPTLAEIFGLPTPPGAMGTSLLPLAEGRSKRLPRKVPLAAEGRLKRALFLPGNLKVIEDDRHKTAEVYDLTADPREERNLFEVEPERSARAQETLRAFFEESALRLPGYRPPYKR